MTTQDKKVVKAIAAKEAKAAVKEVKAEVKVVKAAVMEHGEIQSKDSPPAVAKGKKAIWHAPYQYTGKNGPVTVRGHWEVVKDVPKVEKSEVKK